MKKMLALLTAISVMGTLVGCGASGQKTPAPTTETTTAAPTVTIAGESDRKGEIHYVSMWNETEPQAEVIKAAVEEFTTMYPEVKINIDWMGRDTLKTIKASLDAGQVDIWDQGINNVIAQYNDYGYEMSELYAAPSDLLGGKSYNDVANPVLIKAVEQFAADGKSHGVPYQPNVVAVFYNKDLFAKAGITGEPQTWTELMDACQKLKDAGITAFSFDDGYIILPFAMYLGRLKGADFNKTLVGDATGAAWDDPAVKQAAEAMQEMWDKGYVSKNAASNKYPEGQNEVAMGEAAMYLVGSYMLNEVREITGDGFNWGTFSFPSPEGAVMPTTANSIGMNIMQITKTCKDPQLAFDFITFLTTGKYDTMMSEQCNAMPNTVDTPWPAVVASAKPVLDSTTENVIYSFYINSNSNFTPLYKEQAQKLLGGQIKADEFIANCKAAVMGK